MKFVAKVLLFPVVLLSAFLVLMLKWTLNLSAFVLALPMLYIFGCGLYTLYCREWLQFLILLVAEFGCFVLIFMGTLIADAVERFSGWVAGLWEMLWKTRNWRLVILSTAARSFLRCWVRTKIISD